MANQPTVYIVDDDESVRRSLRWLIESAQFAVETFPSGEAFLDHYDAARPGCVILDVRMNGMNGLEVQQNLLSRKFTTPIIVMTGHADVQTCKKAFKAGAVDFIEKPADDAVLIQAIQRALETDAERRQSTSIASQFPTQLAELTPREMEVMELIVEGRNLKQVAADLNISAQTTAKHRTRILAKLAVENDVELTRLVFSAKQHTTR